VLGRWGRRLDVIGSNASEKGPQQRGYCDACIHKGEGTTGQQLGCALTHAPMWAAPKLGRQERSRIVTSIAHYSPTASRLH
jgi:hypothetical protein